MFLFAVNDNTVNLNETVGFTFKCFIIGIRLIHLRDAESVCFSFLEESVSCGTFSFTKLKLLLTGISFIDFLFQ